MKHLRRLLTLLLLVYFAILAWAIVAHAQLATPHPPGWGYPPSCALGNSCVVAPPPAAKLGSSRRMYDSIELSAFPADPFAAAGYTSGFWPTFPVIRARWPRTHTISIAVAPDQKAACADIEPGDLTPAEAPAWDRARMAEGEKPCDYSSYWEFVSEVRPELERAGIKRPQVLEIDADYLGCPRLDKGFDATQCTDHALNRNLDESVVTHRFLRIAEPPFRPYARQIRALQVKRSRNQIRERRQKCGHIPQSRKRDRDRCSIERKRVVSFTAQIKRLERG